VSDENENADPEMLETGDIRLVKVCIRDGHNFQPLEDVTERRTVGADTHVYRTFWCNKCGRVIKRQVSVWKDFIPKPNRKE
jgi:hypothetical protein